MSRTHYRLSEACAASHRWWWLSFGSSVYRCALNHPASRHLLLCAVKLGPVADAAVVQRCSWHVDGCFDLQAMSVVGGDWDFQILAAVSGCQKSHWVSRFFCKSALRWGWCWLPKVPSKNVSNKHKHFCMVCPCFKYLLQSYLWLHIDRPFGTGLSFVIPAMYNRSVLFLQSNATTKSTFMFPTL